MEQDQPEKEQICYKEALENALNNNISCVMGELQDTERIIEQK
jgi:hypothetical protein